MGLEDIMLHMQLQELSFSLYHQPQKLLPRLIKAFLTLKFTDNHVFLPHFFGGIGVTLPIEISFLFLLVILETGVSQSFSPGWLWTTILSISDSQAWAKCLVPFIRQLYIRKISKLRGFFVGSYSNLTFKFKYISSAFHSLSLKIYPVK
jgi:hypothetical protein